MESREFAVVNLSILDTKRIAQLNETQAQKVIYREEAPKSDGSEHGELGTIALIGGINLLVLAAGYFFGKSKSESVSITVETVEPDGTTRRIWITVDKKSREPVETQIASQIEAALGGA